LARAEIWIEISIPCAPLLRLWDHKLSGYQTTSVSPKPRIYYVQCKEKRVKRKGADTLLVKRKMKSNDTGTEKKTGTQQYMKKVKEA